MFSSTIALGGSICIKYLALLLVYTLGYFIQDFLLAPIGSTKEELDDRIVVLPSRFAAKEFHNFARIDLGV